MSILIADDDPATLTTETVLLQKHGYHVITCDHGPEIMSSIIKHRPQVVLLDLAMPLVSGFDVALELRKRPDVRPTLLIALTGYADDGAKEMTERAGFDYHLVKPIDIPSLLALLEAAELPPSQTVAKPGSQTDK